VAWAVGPEGRRFRNRFGLCAETGHKPKQFAPRTNSGDRARAHSLPSMMQFAPGTAANAAETYANRFPSSAACAATSRA